MAIKKVGVCGCGLMGSGIAQVSAMAGFDVTVLEAEQRFLDKGFAGIEKSLAKFAERPVEKGGITAQQKEEIRGRLKGTTKAEDLADCDIVIEAIIENVPDKKKLYERLDAVVKKDAIFATNTSSISVTELMTATKRPERFVGLHFFNPVPLMKLVEVVRTIATDPAVYESAYGFAKKLGKVPVQDERQDGIHRESAAGAVSAGCGACVRRGRWVDRGHRYVDEAGLRLSDGSVYAAGFCWAGHDVLHHARDVRRIQGAQVRVAVVAAEDGAGGLVWAQERQGILRLCESGEAGGAGCGAAGDGGGDS